MNINKKIIIFINGCPENRIDGARVQEFLKENTYQITDNYLEADVIIFIACKTIGSIEIIKDLKKNNKSSAELIVYGCLPKFVKRNLIIFIRVFRSDLMKSNISMKFLNQTK